MFKSKYREDFNGGQGICYNQLRVEEISPINASHAEIAWENLEAR